MPIRLGNWIDPVSLNAPEAVSLGLHGETHLHVHMLLRYQATYPIEKSNQATSFPTTSSSVLICRVQLLLLWAFSWFSQKKRGVFAH
jgi:hypothetical protein